MNETPLKKQATNPTTFMDFKAKSNRHIPEPVSNSAEHSRPGRLPEVKKPGVDVPAFRVSLLKLSVRLIKEKKNEYEHDDSAMQLTRDIYSKIIRFNYGFKLVEVASQDKLLEDLRKLLNPIELFEGHLLCLVRNIKIEQSFRVENEFDWSRRLYSLARISTSMIELQDPLSRMAIRRINREHLVSCRPQVLDSDDAVLHRVVEHGEPKVILLLLKGGLFRTQHVGPILARIQQKLGEAMKCFFLGRDMVADLVAEYLWRPKDEAEEACLNLIKPELPSLPVVQMRTVLKILVQCILLVVDTNFEHVALSGHARKTSPDPLYPFEDETLFSQIKSIYFDEIVPHIYSLQLVNGVLVEPGTDELCKTVLAMLMSVDGDPIAQSMQIYAQQQTLGSELAGATQAAICLGLDQLINSILEGIWDTAAKSYWQNELLRERVSALNSQISQEIAAADSRAKKLAMAASNFALLYLNLIQLMSVCEESVGLNGTARWFWLLQEYLRDSPPVVKNALLMKREWQLLVRLSHVYPQEVVVVLSQALHENPTVPLSEACCLALTQFLRQNYAARFDNASRQNVVFKKMLADLMLQLLENTQQVEVKVRLSKELYAILLSDELYSLRYLLGISELHQDHDLARPPAPVQSFPAPGDASRSVISLNLDLIFSVLRTFNHVCRYNKPDAGDFCESYVDDLGQYEQLARMKTGPLFLAEIVKMYSHLYIRNNIDYNDLVILDEPADDQLVIERSAQNVEQLERALQMADRMAAHDCPGDYLEVFLIRGVLESLYKLTTLTVQAVPRSKYSHCNLYKLFNRLKASQLQVPSVQGFQRAMTDEFMKVYEVYFNSIIDNLELFGGIIDKTSFSRYQNFEATRVYSSKGLIYDSIQKLKALLDGLAMPPAGCAPEHALYDLHHEVDARALAANVRSTGSYCIELLLQSMRLQRAPAEPGRGELARAAEAYRNRKRRVVLDEASFLYQKLDEPADEDKVTYSLVVYLAFSSLSSFSCEKYRDKINKMLKIFYDQPAILPMVEVLSNSLMLRGGLVRPFINGRFFGQEAVDDEDEPRGAEAAGQKPASKQPRAKVGRQIFDHLLQSIVYLQYVINQSYQNDLIAAHSNVYYQLCFFVKSLIEENYEPFKAEFQKTTMDIKMVTFDRLEAAVKPVIINLSCICLMMKGLAHPRELPKAVAVRGSIVDDRHELLVFNYVSVITLSELIFGVDSHFMKHSFDKKYHKLGLERYHMTVNHHIKHMLLWSNIISPDADAPQLKLQEELVRYLSYLFEHNKALVDSVLDSQVGKDCDIKVTPTLIYNQAVSYLKVLHLSHLGQKLPANCTDPFATDESAAVDEHALKKVYNKNDRFSKHSMITIARLLYRLMKIFKSSDKNRQFAIFLEKLDDPGEPSSKEKEAAGRHDSWTYRRDPIAARRKGEVFYRFLKLVSGAVEVKLKNGALMIVDFPILPECFMITSNSKKEFMENVPVGDHGAKLVSMMEEVENFQIEGLQNKQLSDRVKLIGAIVTNDSFEWMMIIAWSISLLMNAVALVFYDFKAGRARSEWYWAFNAVCNLVILAWSSTMGLIYLVAKTNENYQKRLKKAFEDIALNYKYKFVKRALYCYAFCRDVVDHQTIVTVSGLHILFALLYLADYKYFLPWHLLLGINLSKPAKYVMKSITVHYNQIVWTLSLVAIVVYLYALLIFLFFRAQFDESITEGNLEVCPSLGVCYAYVVDLGLRNGGGIADVMKLLDFSSPSYFPKFVLNVSFFIFINIVSLNIVFGIITDTFDQLRKESVERGRLGS